VYYHPYTNSKIPEQLDSLFTYKNHNNEESVVSIGFYYDLNKDAGIAIAYIDSETNQVIGINLAKLSITSLYDINNTIKHELVHIIDPKVFKKDIFDKLTNNKNVDNLDTYYKLPYEFDAFSYELITTIKSNLKHLDKSKINSIINIIQDLKDNSLDYVIDKYSNEETLNVFIDNGFDEKNKNDFKRIKNSIEPIKAWWTKPTMIKTFFKRLSKII
jgi:hypothetical protein